MGALGPGAAPSPTQASRRQESRPGWVWCAELAELAPLHLLVHPESHDHIFLIQEVGHFSKYERKQPVTTPTHS